MPVPTSGDPFSDAGWALRFQALPKAELHLHLEGTIEPAAVVALGEKYGDVFDESAVSSRYATCHFAAFIEAYKWVTSYLRGPEDYALIAQRMCDQLLRQNVVYAEVTLSVGVMLLRKQNVSANFSAILDAVAPYQSQGLRLQWIFDAARQFGAAQAREVAKYAVELRYTGVIGLGLGGDELSLPAADFSNAYEYAGGYGLHRLVHAGEIGGPDSVRDAAEILRAERIGHGITSAADPKLMKLLAERSIALEICPTSNLRTGALARFLGRAGAFVDHPLPVLFRAGIPVSLSTDDPAMFRTSLLREYGGLGQMGLDQKEMLSIAEGGFRQAFLAPDEKAALLGSFHEKAGALGLL